MIHSNDSSTLDASTAVNADTHAPNGDWLTAILRSDAKRIHPSFCDFHLEVPGITLKTETT